MLYHMGNSGVNLLNRCKEDAADTDLVDLMNYDSSLVYAPETVQGTGAAVRLCDTQLLSGVPYVLTNKNSGLRLETADGNIQQWADRGSSTQEWRIIAAEDGYCKICSMNDESMCVTADGTDDTDGINIVLKPDNGADNQRWKLVQNAGYYGIVSKCSADKAGLDVYDFSTENGGNINQWEYWGGDCQLWRIDAVRPAVPDGTYTVRNINSGFFLASENGSAVQADSEIWTFKRSGDAYIILNADGLALTVADGSAENGANLTLESENGGQAQQFTLRVNGDGSYSLLSVVSGGTACADVYEISLDAGANICQWEYWGGDGQKFVLEPVNMQQDVQGDVNGDGIFNNDDAVALQRYLLTMDTQLANWQAGDYNADSQLTATDLALMKHGLIG